MAWSEAARQAAAEARKAHSGAKSSLKKNSIFGGGAWVNPTAKNRQKLAQSIRAQRSGSKKLNQNTMNKAVVSTRLRNAANAGIKATPHYKK